MRSALFFLAVVCSAASAFIFTPSKEVSQAMPSICFAIRGANGSASSGGPGRYQSLADALHHCGEDRNASFVIIIMPDADYKITPSAVRLVPDRIMGVMLYGYQGHEEGESRQVEVYGNFGSGLHKFALSMYNLAFRFGSRGDCSMGFYAGAVVANNCTFDGGHCKSIFEDKLSN